MSQNVTPKQQRGIDALLAKSTLTAAAAEAGVSRRTIARWLEQPAFRAELARAQSAMFSTAARLAVAAMSGALATLLQIARDASQPAGARVSAARCLLDTAARLTELSELETRITELEERLP